MEKWETCFARWTKRADGIAAVLGIDITVSKLLEKSTMVRDGQDLADILLEKKSQLFAL